MPPLTDAAGKSNISAPAADAQSICRGIGYRMINGGACLRRPGWLGRTAGRLGPRDQTRRRKSSLCPGARF